LTIREPTKAELWLFGRKLLEYNHRSLLAEGKDVTIFCHFENGKILWLMK